MFATELPPVTMIVDISRMSGLEASPEAVAALVTKPAIGLRCVSPPQTPWNFPYRFLPKFRAGRGQIGRSSTTIKLKYRKTLHLADAEGCGKGIQ
jgi:hypothetical protein